MPRAPRPASRTYAFIGVGNVDGTPSARTIVLDAQFRFTGLRNMLAAGVWRVVVLSEERPSPTLVAQAERVAAREAMCAPRPAAGATSREQLGLVAGYPDGPVDEDAPLIAISASLDEATAAALEFVDRGATSIDVVTFPGGGVSGLVQTMLELAERSNRRPS